MYYWPKPDEKIEIEMNAMFCELDHKTDSIFNRPDKKFEYISQVKQIYPPVHGLQLKVEYRRVHPHADPKGMERTLDLEERITVPLREGECAAIINKLVANNVLHVFFIFSF